MGNEIQRIRNDTLRKFDLISRGHVNCIRFSRGESKEHRKLKIRACEEYFDMGMDFLTEAVLGDHKADTVILDLNLVIESAVSETEKSLAEKEAFYTRKGFRFEARR